MGKQSVHHSEQILKALSNETQRKLSRIAQALLEDNKSSVKQLLKDAIQTEKKSLHVLRSILAYLKDPTTTSLPLDEICWTGNSEVNYDRETRAIHLYFLQVARELQKHAVYDYASIIAQSLFLTTRTAIQLACHCENKAGRANKARTIAFFNRDDKLVKPFLSRRNTSSNARSSQDTDTTHSVSVIVPIYNAEKYLHQTLLSVVSQKHPRIEIIVIDDGSTDSSYSILNSFVAKADGRIKIIKNDQPVGPGQSRNQGMSIATGDFIGFVDADDWIEEDYFSKLLASADRSTDIICAQGYYEVIGDEASEHMLDITHFINPESPLYRLCPSTTVWDKLFRKDFLSAHNITFPDLPACVDAPFVIRACQLAKNTSISSGVSGYHYRIQTENSVTKTRRSRTYPDFVFKAYSELESTIPHQGSDATFADCVKLRKWLSLMYTYNIAAAEHRPDLFREINDLKLTDDVSHVINLALISNKAELVDWIRSLSGSKHLDPLITKETAKSALTALEKSPNNQLARKEFDSIEFSRQLSLAKKTKHIHFKWYAKTYPEIGDQGLDPATHYLLHGAAKGYNPGKDFNTQYYLKRYPDAATSGLNPLVHYALYGKAAGYETREKTIDAQKQVDQIRTKLLSFGFTERPLAELTEIAKTSDHSILRALSARELAVWNMRIKSEDGYRTALTWIDSARDDAPDQSFQAKLLLIELLCHYHLGNHYTGLSVYDKAVQQGFTSPDLTLARANFEQTLEARVYWVNKALSHYEIEPIMLLPDYCPDNYDRLTCEVELPKITEGPLVTILIAAYNAAKTLSTALRSLQSQTWSNLEIIVLDDCSPTFDTVRVAEEYAAKDKRIKIIRMDQNGGAYVARNKGLEMATGEFITLHDADDWSHPRKIEVQVKFMLENTDVLGCTSQQSRATNDLIFSRPNADSKLITLNTSSLFLRRAFFIEHFGGWDTVRFEADTELRLRIEKKLGKRSLRKIPTGPLSFQRISDSSIVADSFFGSDGFSYGARLLYREAAANFRRSSNSYICETKKEVREFSTPHAMRADKNNNKQIHAYDVILASEFRMVGGSTRSNIEELICQRRANLKQAVMPMFRYDLGLKYNIFSILAEGLGGDPIDVLAYGEEAACDILILRYPPILYELTRYMPKIHAKTIKVIVNQPPMSDYGPNGVIRYELKKCAENIRHYFGKDATWYPIGPLVREALHKHHSNELHYINLSGQNWHNIIDISAWDRGKRSRGPNDKLRIGRHSRDHIHKWPDSASDITAAYPEIDDVDIYILGGANKAFEIIGHTPKNWKVYEFGSVEPRIFLHEIDIWVYFANPGWVESFGRTIIEAMAVGVPVILPDTYRPLFNDSVIYATPQTAVDLARKLHSDPVAYDYHVKKGKAYVRQNFSYELHLTRLMDDLEAGGGSLLHQ